MSLDPYHFHMVLRQQEIIRADGSQANAQAARIAHWVWRLGHAVARAALALRPAARPDPRRLGATMQPRRNP